MPGKELFLNPRTRSLIVTDSENNLKKVEDFLKNMPAIAAEDRPLETRIYKLHPEIAKERKAMIVRISNIVTEIGLRNQNDLTMLEGKLAGLELALNLADKRFKAIVAEEERKRELFPGGPHSPRGTGDSRPSS